MQIDTGSDPSPAFSAPGGIAATFSEWADTHRAMGGDYDERALSAGIQACAAAYRSGLSQHQAFEIGRQAFYSALS